MKQTNTRSLCRGNVAMSKKLKAIKAARPDERRQTIAEIIEKYRDKMKSKMRSASPAKSA